MENQHRKISGYRELSQEEVDLMNRIKAFGPELGKLILDIEKHIANQYTVSSENQVETSRLIAAEPYIWMIEGRHDLQTGLMKLTRAIAQPNFF